MSNEGQSDKPGLSVLSDEGKALLLGPATDLRHADRPDGNGLFRHGHVSEQDLAGVAVGSNLFMPFFGSFLGIISVLTPIVA